jgi:hypothetical protein
MCRVICLLVTANRSSNLPQRTTASLSMPFKTVAMEEDTTTVRREYADGTALYMNRKLFWRQYEGFSDKRLLGSGAEPISVLKRTGWTTTQPSDGDGHYVGMRFTDDGGWAVTVRADLPNPFTYDRCTGLRLVTPTDG